MPGALNLTQVRKGVKRETSETIRRRENDHVPPLVFLKALSKTPPQDPPGLRHRPQKIYRAHLAEQIFAMWLWLSLARFGIPFWLVGEFTNHFCPFGIGMYFDPWPCLDEVSLQKQRPLRISSGSWLVRFTVK